MKTLNSMNALQQVIIENTGKWPGNKTFLAHT